MRSHFKKGSSNTCFNFANACARLLLLLSASLTLSIFSTAWAAETLPEEISVNAPVRMTNLKAEVNAAEDAMYDLFNTLNDDDRFDIYCMYAPMKGSRMQQRVCAPNYIRTAQEEEAQFALAFWGFAGAERGYAGTNAVEHYNNLLKEKMIEIYKNNPELQQAMNEVNTLKANYESVRKDRAGIE